MSPETENSNPQMLISYLLLRKLIGILGIMLPIALLLGSITAGDCNEVQNSISDYYHTNMRDVLVGVMCAVALFLFAYKGYDYKDALAGNLGCLFALGVAFFPTTIGSPLEPCNIESTINSSIIGKIHLTSASLFFSVLIYFSLVLFTKSKRPKSEFSIQKKRRNTIYKCCGYIMIACVVLIAIYFLFLEERFPNLHQLDPIFWLESIALWAFGTSWLTKGQLLFKDIDA
jgi:hypothetical protein